MFSKFVVVRYLRRRVFTHLLLVGVFSIHLFSILVLLVFVRHVHANSIPVLHAPDARQQSKVFTRYHVKMHFIFLRPSCFFTSGVGKFVDAVVAFRICVGNMCLKISLFTEFEFANPFEARVVLNICVGDFLEVVVVFKSCIGKSFKS